MPARRRPASPGAHAPRVGAYTAALRLLGRRDCTVAELTARLLDREYPAPDVQQAVDRLTADGSLDDRRVAFNHVRAADRKSRGRRRIRQELEARGIDGALIDEALALRSPDDDLRAIERFLERRQVPGALPASDQRRIVQRLLRRGFSADVIARALRGRGPSE